MIIEKEKLLSLVTNAQRGDNDATNELFNTFYNDFYYFALKTVKDEDLALDITQEAFIEILNTIGNLKEPAAFVTWAKQVVYHQCTRYFKKKKDVLVDENEDGSSIFDTVREENSDFIPDEALDRADFKKTILDILDELSEEQRTATILYYFDEMSVKEIAEIQGVSEGTIKSRLNYARKAIKAAVEEYEKKNGVKLHALPFLPLFKWLFDGAFEGGLSASSATALAKGVSAASGASLSVSSSAAVTTAATVGAAASGFGVKIIAGIVAAALVIGGGSYVIFGRGDKTPDESKPTTDNPSISAPADDSDSEHTHSWSEWYISEEAYGVIKIESKTRTCSTCKETETEDERSDMWDFFEKHFGGDNLFLDRYFDVANKTDGPFDINGLFAAGDHISGNPEQETTTVSADEYYKNLRKYFTLSDSVVAQMKQTRTGDTYTFSFDYSGSNLMPTSCVYNGGKTYTVYYTAGGSHAAYLPVFAAEIEYNRHEGGENKILSLKTDGINSYDMNRAKKDVPKLESFIKTLMAEVGSLSDYRTERLIALPERLDEDYALFKAMDLFGFGLSEEEFYGKYWGNLVIDTDGDALKRITAHHFLPQFSYNEDGKKAVSLAAFENLNKFASIMGGDAELGAVIIKNGAETEIKPEDVTNEIISEITGNWASNQKISFYTKTPIEKEGKKLSFSYTITSPEGFNETEYSAEFTVTFE